MYIYIYIYICVCVSGYWCTTVTYTFCNLSIQTTKYGYSRTIVSYTFCNLSIETTEPERILSSSRIQTNKYGYSRTIVTYTFFNPSIQTNKYGYSRTTVCNHMVTAVIRTVTINGCMKYTFGCLGWWWRTFGGNNKIIDLSRGGKGKHSKCGCQNCSHNRVEFVQGV